MINQFKNRTEAGQLLAEKLSNYGSRSDVVVLALPRGGVPVAFQVAKTLNAPLDVFVVRKLGVPDHEELAMGAIATGGARILNEFVVSYYGIHDKEIESITERERKELTRRERLYRGERAPLDFSRKTVILVDDGVATGSTMLAAIAALKGLKPARIVVAVPVGPNTTLNELRTEVDEVVCVMIPRLFDSVGNFYADFDQTADGEVSYLLDLAAEEYATRHADLRTMSSK